MILFLSQHADGLSRLPQKSTPQSEQPAEVSLFNIGQIHNLPISSTLVQRATRDDPLLSKVYSFVRDGWPGQWIIPTSILTGE